MPTVSQSLQAAILSWCGLRRTQYSKGEPLSSLWGRRTINNAGNIPFTDAGIELLIAAIRAAAF